MTAIVMADNFVCTVQAYFLATIVCRVYKMKYNYWMSLGIIFLCIMIAYFPSNYMTKHIVIRAISGFVSIMLPVLILSDGEWAKTWAKAIFIYAIAVGIDAITYFVMGTWLPEVSYTNITVTAPVVLYRNQYNLMCYLAYALLDFLERKKERRYLSKIFSAAIVFAFCQIGVFLFLVKSNLQGLVENILVVSVFYSGIVLLGYQITMELFFQIVDNRQKRNEIEQKMREKKYQYNYYLLAYEQSERIRDMRHDMRNQLQIMQNLMETGGKEGQERARGMLVELERELEG